MLLDDKKKKKFYRPKQKTKSQPTQSASNVTQKQAETQPTVTPGNDVRPQPFTFFNQQQPAQQQPIIAQETTQPTNQQNSLPPTGMQSLVTQGYDPTMLMQSIVNSPTLARIKENDEKIARLKETPVQDKDGFWWSFAKAGLSGLAQAFNPANPIRNDGDFYNRLGYAAGSAVGGGVNRKWNEVQNIQNEIGRAYQENEILTERAKQEFDMQQRAAQYAMNTQKAIDNSKSLEQRALDRKRQLDLNEGRFNFSKLRADQQNLLKGIQMKGFYKEGIDTELDKKLQDAGVVMADFDSRPPIVKEQGGKYYQYDRSSEKWVESNGIPVDESEVPIEFSVDGQRLMLRPRDIANIKAAEQRQVSQQTFQAGQNAENRAFQAGQNDLNRAQRWDMFKQALSSKWQKDSVNRQLDKVKIRKELKASLSNLEMTEDEYNEMLALLNAIPD